MKYWPIGLFVEVAESLIGRAIFFAAIFLIAILLEVSIATKEIAVSPVIFAYLGLSFFLAFSNSICALLSLALIISFVIYLRFEIKYWFLIPVFILSICHAYFIHQVIRDLYQN